MYGILNLFWFVLGGFVLFFGYLFLGLILCLTLIGIPAGVQCIKLALLSVSPFGRTLSCHSCCTGILSTPLNLIWILLGGFLLALLHTFIALICAVTLIGLPFAKQHIKLATLALTPFGKNLI